MWVYISMKIHIPIRMCKVHYGHACTWTRSRVGSAFREGRGLPAGMGVACVMRQMLDSTSTSLNFIDC